MTASVDVTFVGHATVLLELDGVRVLTDPFLRRSLGPLQRHGPLPHPDELGAIDLVVISHGHPDHFDPESLAALRGRPSLVVPRGLGPTVRNALARRATEVVEVVAGESIELRGIELRAVPARHWITPRAPRAEPIGYLLAAASRVYFAGDTGRFSGLDDLAGTADLALLPVWTWGPHLGPGHLGPRSAAEVLRDIAPVGGAVPIHWGTLYPRRLHRVWRRPLSDPGDRFARDAAVTAPDVDVRVLRPGASTRFTFDGRRPEEGEP